MTTRLDRIIQQRRQKLERLRARGINPYPHRYARSHSTREAIALLEQSEAGQAGAHIREQHPNLQVEVIKGGQPHYNYIVSVE